MARNETAVTKLKEHRLLRFLMPLLACIYGLLIAVACGMVLKVDFVWWRCLLSDLLMIVAILLTVWLIQRPLTCLFPQVARYHLCKSKGYAVAFIALVTPLCVMLLHLPVQLLAEHMGSVALQPFADYQPGEIWQDLYRSVGAVLLAPTLEELCFRMMSLAPVKTKSRQVLTAMVVSLFFGLLHASNFFSATVHGLAFSLIFILTGNLLYSICAHACANLTATLLGVMAHLNLWQIKMNEFPQFLAIENVSAWYVLATLAAVGGCILAVGLRKERQAVVAAKN